MWIYFWLTSNDASNRKCILPQTWIMNTIIIIRLHISLLSPRVSSPAKSVRGWSLTSCARPGHYTSRWASRDLRWGWFLHVGRLLGLGNDTQLLAITTNLPPPPEGVLTMYERGASDWATTCPCSGPVPLVTQTSLSSGITGNSLTPWRRSKSSPCKRH